MFHANRITGENWMESGPWIELRLVEGMSSIFGGGEETAVFWHAPQFTGPLFLALCFSVISA